MSLAANAARMIARKGETMTLNRDGETSIALKGKRATGALGAVGNADQQSFKVRISPAELTASAWATKVPSAGGDGAGDSLTVGGRVRNVLDVMPLMDGDVVAMYELEVAG